MEPIAILTLISCGGSALVLLILASSITPNPNFASKLVFKVIPYTMAYMLIALTTLVLLGVADVSLVCGPVPL